MNITFTDDVEHTDQHTLKEILSAWFLMFGLREVTYRDLGMFENCDASYYFDWWSAVTQGCLTRESRPGPDRRNLNYYSLTQKALDYIKEN